MTNYRVAKFKQTRPRDMYERKGYWEEGYGDLHGGGGGGRRSHAGRRSRAGLSTVRSQSASSVRQLTLLCGSTFRQKTPCLLRVPFRSPSSRNKLFAETSQHFIFFCPPLHRRYIPTYPVHFLLQRHSLIQPSSSAPIRLYRSDMYVSYHTAASLFADHSHVTRTVHLT